MTHAGPKSFLLNLSLNDSFAVATAMNLIGTKNLLGHGSSAFAIKSKPVFSNDPRSLRTNPPNRTIVNRWIFENFIVADERFAKVLQSL